MKIDNATSQGGGIHISKEISKKVLLVGLMALLFSGFLFSSHAVAKGLKKVVAVSRFENKSSFGSGGRFHLGDGMADQLTDALLQSDQFVVLERQTLTDVIAEQDMAASGRFQKSKSARTGKLTSAQILIKGTITEFDLKTSGSGTGIGFGGIRVGSKREEAHVGLIIRLINTTTGELLDSQRVEGKAEAGGFKFGVSAGSVDFGTESFKRTPLGKATQIAIDNAVEFVAEGLRDVPYQGRVIKASGSMVIISAGENAGASAGDVFTVCSVGEELTDPDTGEILGVEEQEIGKVKIIQVLEKYSKAKVVGTASGTIKRGDIVRAE